MERTEPSSAFAVRLHNFTDEMLFYAPGIVRYQTGEFSPENLESFIPVSLTGAQCALHCDHCQGKLLRSMHAVDSPDSLWNLCSQAVKRGTRGILISGGCDPAGKVPISPFSQVLRRISRELNLKMVVHTGLIDEESAAGLKEVGVKAAMLDIIGSAETVKAVYHLPSGIEAYERSLEMLARHGVPTVPHVVLGLHYGKIVGEDNALEMIARHPVAALVLVVISPLDGTAMSGVEPPPPDDIRRLFEKARRLLPETPVILGCARPMGPARVVIDSLAVDCGLNGIAYPAEGIVEYARSKGLAPLFYEECCSLAYTQIRHKEPRH